MSNLKIKFQYDDTGGDYFVLAFIIGDTEFRGDIHYGAEDWEEALSDAEHIVDHMLEVETIDFEGFGDE